MGKIEMNGRGDAMRSLCFSFITAFLLITFSAVGMADAAGTLRLTFKRKDSSGVEEPLSYAYVYLRNISAPPPMEKFFAKPDHIFGPTGGTGLIQVSVPEGDYFIRVTRRNPTVARPLGPPEPGDYSWTPITPISITTNTVTDLGTQYGEDFGGEKIRIYGVIKSAYGTPIPGKYVRVQTEPCILGNEYTLPNFCGPVKLLAQQRTDANGAYSITLKNPGSYYVIVSHTLGKVRDCNSTTTGKSIGPIAFAAGDNRRMPDIIYTW